MSKKIPDWKEKRIIKMLLETDLSEPKIANVLNVGRWAITRIKRENNIGDRDTTVTLLPKLKGKGLGDAW